MNFLKVKSTQLRLKYRTTYMFQKVTEKLRSGTINITLLQSQEFRFSLEEYWKASINVLKKFHPLRREGEVVRKTDICLSPRVAKTWTLLKSRPVIPRLAMARLSLTYKALYESETARKVIQRKQGVGWVWQ